MIFFEYYIIGENMSKYNRQKVYEYAKKWAYGRNPKYYNFDPVGGDCTNFVSQCIYAGCSQMNYNINYGWYYINGNNKSPSWTGVEYLYKFLISNKGSGPHGKEVRVDELKIWDVIQLSFNNDIFSHSLVVVQNGNSAYNTLIAAHTYNVFGKRLSEYTYEKYRCLHIEN